MKISARQSLIGGAFAWLLATSCCWLPALAVALGGAGWLLPLSDRLNKNSGLFMIAGTVFFALGAFSIYRNKVQKVKVVFQSEITCPVCGHKKVEIMPADACQYFYECDNCKKIIKPNHGDCCVFCSFGTVPCPPVQRKEDCC